MWMKAISREPDVSYKIEPKLTLEVEPAVAIDHTLMVMFDFKDLYSKWWFQGQWTLKLSRMEKKKCFEEEYEFEIFE